MKTLLMLCLCVVTFISCSISANSEVKELNGEEFESFKLDSTCAMDESLILFKDRMFDFGKINRRDVAKLSISFPYANVGNSRLVIFKTDVSCGCLTVNHSKKPLSRGEVGLIDVLVDIKGQQGTFNKTVFVKSNARNDVEIIRIKGVVE